MNNPPIKKAPRRIHIQVGDLETTWDLSRDPLIILLTAEGNESEVESHESTLLSSKAVTKVKNSETK